jgi:hypothetical protein
MVEGLFSLTYSAYSLQVQRVIVAHDHTHTHTRARAVGLLWTSDLPDAETST